MTTVFYKDAEDRARRRANAKKDLQVAFDLENKQDDAYKERYGLPVLASVTPDFSYTPVNPKDTKSSIELSQWIREQLTTAGMPNTQIDVFFNRLSQSQEIDRPKSDKQQDLQKIYDYWNNIISVIGFSLTTQNSGLNFGNWIAKFLTYTDKNPTPTLKQLQSLSIGDKPPDLLTNEEVDNNIADTKANPNKANANLKILRDNYEQYASFTYPSLNWFQSTVGTVRTPDDQKKVDTAIYNYYHSTKQDSAGGYPWLIPFNATTYQNLIKFENGGIVQPEPSTTATPNSVGTGRHRQTKSKNAADGISPDTNDQYIQFGKFCFFLPALRKRVLTVKYAKSLGTCPRYPRTLISTKFTEFLLDLMENKHCNLDMFKLLNEKEQQLFKKLAVEGKVMEKLGMKDYHFDDTEDKDLDRFELLRGELLAGNNAPELLKELRGYILKFIADGRLKYTDGHKLLAEIALVL